MKSQFITQPDVPYPDFDEEFYMKKAKIKMERRTGGDRNEYWFMFFFLIPLFIIYNAFIKTPMYILIQRKMAYDLYLKDCEDLKKQREKNEKLATGNVEDFEKFYIYYAKKR